MVGLSPRAVLRVASRMLSCRAVAFSRPIIHSTNLLSELVLCVLPSLSLSLSLPSSATRPRREGLGWTVLLHLLVKGPEPAGQGPNYSWGIKVA